MILMLQLAIKQPPNKEGKDLIFDFKTAQTREREIFEQNIYISLLNRITFRWECPIFNTLIPQYSRSKFPKQ